MNISETQLLQFVDYRNKAAHSAAQLFEKIVFENDSVLSHRREFTILVIAAGTFPGFQPLMQRLATIAPELQQVRITLVEPVKKFTDIFMQHFSTSSSHIKTEFTLANVGIETFLKNADGAELFDLVYFEHPEVMTLPILLAKLGIKNFQRVIAFRQSLARLNKVLQPNALVLASCMSQHEVRQLRGLLQLSLGCQLQISGSSRPIHYFFGGPFCVGLRGHLQSTDAPCKKYEKAIQWSDNFLVAVVLLSIVLYLLKLAGSDYVFVRITAVVLILLQLFLHRPGLSGFLLKLGLFIGLLALIKF